MFKSFRAAFDAARAFRRPSVRIAGLVALIGASVLVAGSARSPEPEQTPAGLTRGEWTQIRTAVVADSYKAVAGNGGRVTAANADNDFTAHFGPDGFALASAGDGWTLPVRFAGHGWAGALSPAGAPSVVADGERVELRRGDVTEWYLNKPTGVEQGFTIARAPSGSGDRLDVALDIGGGFTARPVRGGALLQKAGTEIRYDHLVVTDARGRTLASSMAVTDRRIVLSVDTRGAVFPVVVDPTFTQQAKLNAGDPAANDQFGFSVAVSGDTAVVGAYTDDDGGNNTGSVYVFIRTGATWSQQAKLNAGDAAVGDFFGASVAISGDTAVVGANGDDDSGINSGSAYVFTRTGTTWSQQAKLTAGDGAQDDVFGFSVAVSGDTAVVGAYSDDGLSVDSGSAYVFTRTGATWTPQQKLTAADAAIEDQFGYSVSISGNTAVVGAPYDDDSGSVYVFTRTGVTWTPQQKLTASDAAAGDQFGISVSVSGDTTVTGASTNDDAGNGSGSAYVFVRSGVAWSQQSKLTASDAAAGDQFGYSVAVSGDTAVVGAFTDADAGINSGSAYGFTRTGATWSQASKLTASDAAAGDNFGYSVAVSGDTTVVGAWGDDDGGSNAGSAYVFTESAVVAAVPTLSEWALILLGLSLAGGAAVHIQRRRLAA